MSLADSPVDLRVWHNTKAEWRAWRSRSPLGQAHRAVRLVVLYACVLGVLYRTAAWMFLVPAVEEYIDGRGASSLAGRMTELRVIAPAVDTDSTAAKVAAQSGTAVFGWALAQSTAVPVFGEPLSPLTQAGIWATTGYMVLDPLYGVLWEVYTNVK